MLSPRPINLPSSTVNAPWSWELQNNGSLHCPAPWLHPLGGRVGRALQGDISWRASHTCLADHKSQFATFVSCRYIPQLCLRREHHQGDTHIQTPSRVAHHVPRLHHTCRSLVSVGLCLPGCCSLGTWHGTEQHREASQFPCR